MEVKIHSQATSEYSYPHSDCACSSEYLLPVISELLSGLPDGSVVADAGCGNGSMLAAFRRRGFELHGLEISLSGLEQARRAFPQPQYHHVDLSQDLMNTGLTGRCDVVMSTEVIEHVFLPRIFVRNCRKLLKNNGTLILSTPYHGYVKNVLLAVTGRLDRHFTALWDYGHIKFWSRQTLTELLVGCGFEVTAFRGVGRIPYAWKSMVMVARKVR